METSAQNSLFFKIKFAQQTSGQTEKMASDSDIL